MSKKKKDKKRRNDSSSWNIEDLYFDRHGRLVLRNPVLTRRFVEAITRDGGLVIHIDSETSDQAITGLLNIRCPIPLFGCPNPNKTDCPDLICGDRFLKRVGPATAPNPNPPDPGITADGERRRMEVDP